MSSTTTPDLESSTRANWIARDRRAPLAVAMLGFAEATLDPRIVNVALPSTTAWRRAVRYSSAVMLV